MKDEFLDEVPIGMKVYWVFIVLLGLGLIGLGVWAVIKLINHFT